MAPREASQERSNTPDTVEKGMATINTLRYTQDLYLVFRLVIVPMIYQTSVLYQYSIYCILSDLVIF